VLDEYGSGDDSFMIAGMLSASGDFWTIVLLDSPFTITTAIWLILAILALSLMTVSGLIAVRYLGDRDNLRTSSLETHRSESHHDQLTSIEFSEMEPGGDGYSVTGMKDFSFVEEKTELDFASLHEAVLEATDDFVIMVDRHRKVVYSSPSLGNSDSDPTSETDGLKEFADHYLDEKARMKFENWLKEGPETHSLTMDVRNGHDQAHPSRWYASNIETKSGLNFVVFIGRRMMVEEFPLAVH